MPETIVVALDNGISSQNQDYIPSRFISQKETIELLVSKKFEENQETTLGILPLAQERHNEIITPTKQRSHIKTFLNKVVLQRDADVMMCLNQAIHIFNQKEIQDCILVVFLGFEISEDMRSQTHAKIYEILALGVTVKMILFGEAIEFVGTFGEINFPNFSCTTIMPSKEFVECALAFICGGNSFENEDPELAEAIRLSLEEERKRQGK